MYQSPENVVVVEDENSKRHRMLMSVGLGCLLFFSVFLAGCRDAADTSSTTTTGGVTAVPTVSISPEMRIIGPHDNLIIEFDKDVRIDETTFGGPLASRIAEVQWDDPGDLHSRIATLVPNGAWGGHQIEKLTIAAVHQGNVTDLEVEVGFELRFEEMNSSNMVEAQTVVGQATFVAREEHGPSEIEANTFGRLLGNMAYFDGVVYISDVKFRRVLAFDGVPTQNFASASAVVGQNTFTSSLSFQSRTQYFPDPVGISVNEAGDLWVVTDEIVIGRPRAVRFDPHPERDPANLPAFPIGAGMAEFQTMLGQTALSTGHWGCSSIRFNEPAAVAAANGYVAIADKMNHRIMIWDTPVYRAYGAAASYVLGQADMSNCRHNTTGSRVPSNSSLAEPMGVIYVGNKLIVNDTGNNRVLIWNSIPTEGFVPADIVIGQPNFSGHQPNGGNVQPSERTMDQPGTGLYSNGVQLFVADEMNHRVLIWNRIPTENFAPADQVLGQPDFISDAYNNIGGIGQNSLVPDSTSLFSPNGLLVVEDALLVSDSNNFRVLVYRSN